ncbi:MAG: hypothetical protein JST92_05085, partial [Deltaproteobacteria bacterium]|nr:hypothetical protein [Deltaproteobacteria bacterium]
GTLGYTVANGNMETFDQTGQSDELWAEGRAAFYAKGQILGKWLLTMSYDSGKNPSEVDGLFQTIDPQSYYTLYGDGSQQAYDASSARKIYVKLEREQFYALFGDMDTNLTVTELARYSRRLNGVKVEMQTHDFELNGFGAETDKAYVRDELAGDGTSGLYHLSRTGILTNSEIVTIVVRDRFHSERIVSSRPMSRYVDYSIDYDTGALFFREPILSRDDQLNPQVIVVEYELQSANGMNLSLGGRAGLKLLDNKIRVGATVVHQGDGARQAELYGGDVKLQLLPGTRVRAEFAATDNRVDGLSDSIGLAYLAEIAHTSRMFDVRVYARQQQGAFGLGQQAGSEQGTRKEGADGAVRFNEHWLLSGEAYRQDTFSTGAQRLAADARVSWINSAWSAWAGLLEASDALTDGSTHASGQVNLGGKVLLYEDKLSLGLDYYQSAWGNGNVDFPTRLALHADYKLTKNVLVTGAQELTWGSTQTTTDTRLGLRMTPWKGAAITTGLEDKLDENASRVFGNIGLKQTWQVNDAWRIDAGGERSQTVHQSGDYTANPAVSAASGVASVTSTYAGNSVSGTEDFAAGSFGATYQIKNFVWDGRIEGRTSQSEDRLSALSGLVAELGNGWALSGRGQGLGSWFADGSHATVVGLRFGLVFRPPRTRWILLNRLDWIVERRFGTVSDLDSARVMDNFQGNWRPMKDLQLSLGYGIKYARERIEGVLQKGFTDQISVEGRYDLLTWLDLGLRASVLHGWSDTTVSYSVGPSVGVSPATNLWFSLGFNVFGYNDRDFSASNNTAFGPYLRLRLKFDQESVREAAAWLNKQ